MFRIGSICQLLWVRQELFCFPFQTLLFSQLLTHTWGWQPCPAEVLRRFPCQVPQHTVSLGVSLDAHLLAHLPHRPISEPSGTYLTEMGSRRSGLQAVPLQQLSPPFLFCWLRCENWRIKWLWSDRFLTSVSPHPSLCIWSLQFE